MKDGPQDGEGSSIWDRLRRRKVVQWGIAYSAGAWGLLQVLQFLADTYEWPTQVLRLVTLAFAIGLPIALTLAWYHGDRGHQKPVRSELAIIAVLLLLGGGGLWFYQRSTEHVANPTAIEASPAAATPASGSRTAASVAVLPFANLSVDPANEYLADGIAETMITMLAQVPQLLVIGRNSSFSYKGKDVDSRTIGQQLGVGALLEGSVQRAGDRLRVAVQLVNTGDGRHLWAETYDRPTADVFAVQDEIAQRVTEALSVALAGKSGPGAIGTTNVAAYDAYLRGIQRVSRGDNRSLEEGVVLLEQAVAADPNFARAWVELSRAYRSSGNYSGGGVAVGRMDPERAKKLSEDAARRAVEVGPELGAAHAVLGDFLWRAGEYGAAAVEFERAIALSPDDPLVIRLYAPFVGDQRDRKEAVRLFEPLLLREPRDAGIRRSYAIVLDGAGDIGGELRQYKEAMRLEPEGVRTYLLAGAVTSNMLSATDLSIRLFRRAAELDATNPRVPSALADKYWRLGEQDLAREAEAQLSRLGAADELTTVRATSAAWEGRAAEARGILEAALPDTSDKFAHLLALSILRGTRDDYRATLRQVEKALADEPDWNDMFADKVVCLHALIGDEEVAKQRLAQWEPLWHARHAFGWLEYYARIDKLARSLACVGRNDDALTELEALVSEGYNLGVGGWRYMAIDPAYDAIRADPRFRAVSDKLKAADVAARARFRARPELNDADIDALGT
ncbi:MAG: tetratricopeptide repeat protein [Chloroflexi bacterium]|nr:tetratricopeptide repeat protein [Chloroflexota bacterium]